MAAQFDASLATLKDNARALLGDIPNNGETGIVSDPILQDETIEAKLASAGWEQGLAELADMCIGIISREPTKYSESLGILVDFKDRIPSLKRLSNNAREGNIPEPGTTPVSISNKSKGVDNVPTW